MGVDGIEFGLGTAGVVVGRGGVGKGFISTRLVEGSVTEVAVEEFAVEGVSRALVCSWAFFAEHLALSFEDSSTHIQLQGPEPFTFEAVPRMHSSVVGAAF